jgi:hypothetical protein
MQNKNKLGPKFYYKKLEFKISWIKWTIWSVQITHKKVHIDHIYLISFN